MNENRSKDGGRVGLSEPHPKGKGAWYQTTTYTCVLCGSEQVYRERVTDKPRPTHWAERNEYIETACDGHFL